jgi:thiol-disulfide isomerase/thioredoxin
MANDEFGSANGGEDRTPGAEPVDPSPASLPERKPMSRMAAFAAMGIVAFAILLLTMLTPGSGVDPDAPPPGSSATPSAAGSPEPDTGTEAERAGDMAVAGKAAPLRFTLKDMNGVDVKLASFKGKVILVNFWAKWCGPCRAEIPDLVTLQTQYRDDLVILGILVQDRWDDKVQPFAAEMKINYPLLDASERTDVEEAFGPMWGLPTSFIIGRDGRIAKKQTGIGTKEFFEQEIKALL